ncbi:TPA: class I SAM-dependent DNA methyltransferase [Yersinia enterocolitica]
MKNKLISYLKRNKVTEPNQVDRLLISAFITTNNIRVVNNNLILKNLISHDNHSESLLLDELLTIISNEFQIFGFEELIKLFEFVISPSDRVVNGAVYTPSHIRKYITDISLKSLDKIGDNLSVADISCGCGGFLFTACIFLKKTTNLDYYTIFKNHIYGVDIQRYSVNRTKLLLTLLALYHNEDRYEFIFNLYVGDSLSFNWRSHIKGFNGFDIIIGNPPYVCSRNLSEHTKKELKKWSVSSSGNQDLYIPFFQIGFENLSKNGVLGYITMNSFFKSLNGRSLREYFHQNAIFMRVIDFGSEQIFYSKNTYTCICILKKNKLGSIEYCHSNSELIKTDNISFEKIDYNSLDHKKGWNLRNNKLMDKIESTGIPFGEFYKTRHGIATLKNSVYIFKPKEYDDEYYYINKGNKTYKIEKGICRDVVNSNKLSGKYTLRDLNEKLIFPYTDKDNPEILPESFMKINYPYAYNYLLDNKNILDMRDKGKNKNYPCWYAYGRSQSLQRIKNKLFLPKISKTSPNSIISTDENLMFYNGIAIIGHSLRELLLIQKIISSRLFWYYIKKTSKPYSSDYFSLNGNYINNFGIYQFSSHEIDYIIAENDNEKLDDFIESKYGITVPKNLPTE